MCQTVVHEYTARKGKYLRLVLQTAERGGKDQTVVVPLKIGALMFAFVIFVLADAFAGELLVAVHLVLFA